MYNLHWYFSTVKYTFVLKLCKHKMLERFLCYCSAMREYAYGYKRRKVNELFAHCINGDGCPLCVLVSQNPSSLLQKNK